MAFFGLRVVLLLTLSAVYFPYSISARNNVTMLKCCRLGETLQQSEETGEEETVSCVPSSQEWSPLIYSPQQKKAVPIPDHWIIRENEKPNCRDGVLAVVPQVVTNPFILFDSGHVFLESGYGDQYKPGEYCAESEALLVCQPRAAITAKATMKPSLRRCCGTDGAFDQSKKSCIYQKDSTDAPPLVNNVDDFDLSFGFPTCEPSGNHTIVGNASSAKILNDATAQFDGFMVPPGQFCIEKISDKKTVKVFACAEYAPQRSVEY